MEELLIEAHKEIRSLRRTNEVLAAKVETMELFGNLLHANVRSRLHSAGEDVAWKLEVQIMELRAQRKEAERRSTEEGAVE